MDCVVCSSKSPYKCPACTVRYCSVGCYKKHKDECGCKLKSESTTNDSAVPAGERSGDEVTISSEPEAQTVALDTPEEQRNRALLLDPTVQELLRYKGVRNHLRLIARLMDDPALSGEVSAEGRQLVALKKLRELRAGGRESNEAIEEFVQRVSTLLH